MPDVDHYSGPMSLNHMEGREYQAALPVTDAGVGAFVAATSDDGQRWRHHAPPSYAAVALFAVAPAFLFDHAVGAYSAMLIHADQTFTFHSPFEIGMDLEITATVDRVRMRGDVGWVTFTAAVTSPVGPVVDSSSVFLMSASAPPASHEPRSEPPPDARRVVEPPGGLTIKKSVSRADLVRYAAASGDFNPLHWDHDSAVAAGLPGVVAHGLLTAAWATQVVPIGRNAVMPVRSVRFRFPQPVLPNVQMLVSGTFPEEGKMQVTVAEESDGEPAVTAAIELE